MCTCMRIVNSPGDSIDALVALKSFYRRNGHGDVAAIVVKDDFSKASTCPMDFYL